jgi:hypothetical protein
MRARFPTHDQPAAGRWSGWRVVFCALALTLLTSCGGGGGGGGSSGPPPPPTQYRITTNVTDRIDGGPIISGTVEYRDLSGTLQGSCNLGSLPCDVNLEAGTYSRTISPLTGDFVKHKDSAVRITGDATLNDSVIKFGPNSTGVDFTADVLAEYKQTMQRLDNGVYYGVYKWDPLPTKIVIVESSFPDSCKGPGSQFEKFVADYTTVANEDTSFYSGGRMNSLPVSIGTPADIVDGTMEVSGWPPDSAYTVTTTDYPKLSAGKIQRSRTRWNIDFVCNVQVFTFLGSISHEYDFAWGRFFSTAMTRTLLTLAAIAAVSATAGLTHSPCSWASSSTATRQSRETRRRRTRTTRTRSRQAV